MHRLVELGELLEIPVVDYLILTDEGMASLCAPCYGYFASTDKTDERNHD